MSRIAFRKYLWSWISLVVVGILLTGWLSGLPEWCLRQSAMKALSRRDYDVAWERVRLASRIDQNSPETEFLMARLERKRGNLDRVRRHLQRATAKGLDSERVRREELLAAAQTGELAGIVKELDQLLINHSDDGAEICDAYVNGLLINGQLAEADAMLQQWQQAFPDDPQPDYLLGRIAEFNRNVVGAESWYRKSLAKNKRYFLSANALGRILGELNKWEEAFQAYQVCLASQDPAPAQLGIARCLTNLGREKEALDVLRTLAVIPQEKLNNSLIELGESIELDAIGFELGSLEVKQGNAEKAVNLLTRAVEYNPKHREARYQLARALKMMGRNDAAKVHFDWYQETQQKVDEINRVLDQVKRKPQDFELRCQLGMLYLEVGSGNTGAFWLRSVLVDDPTHAVAKEALAKFRDTQRPSR